MAQRSAGPKPGREPASGPGARRERSPAPAGEVAKILQLGTALGNRKTTALLGSVLLQRKVAIGPADDPLEREADRLAERVLAEPATTTGETAEESVASAGAVVQRKCAACEAGGQPCADCEKGEQEEDLRRQPAVGEPAGSPEPAEVDSHFSALGPGQPVPPGLRGYFEPRFGHDFGDVRLHTGSTADAAARAARARAFTLGSDVVFAAGEYTPSTHGGRRLLAHELAHVVQQAPQAVRRQPAPTDDKKKQGPGAERSAIKVVSHGAAAGAEKIARERAEEVIGGMRAPATGELKGATIELHIVPKNKKLTDLPEFSHLKGTKTFDGRKADDVRGVGGIKKDDTIRYAIGEEQLKSIPDKPTGYGLGFVAAHESGHIVEQFGLTAEQQKELKAAYENRKKAKGPWLSPANYTMSLIHEYFAQSTAAYFGHPYSTSAEDKKTYTRKWLKSNDKEMYDLLKKIYK